jgi:hypothetical protein
MSIPRALVIVLLCAVLVGASCLSIPDGLSAWVVYMAGMGTGFVIGTSLDVGTRRAR